MVTTITYLVGKLIIDRIFLSIYHLFIFVIFLVVSYVCLLDLLGTSNRKLNAKLITIKYYWIFKDVRKILLATYNYETNTQVKIERPKPRIFLVSLKKKSSGHACKRHKR
jgi:hypothetical protein